MRHAQRGNRQSPKTISTLHRLASTTTTRLPSRTISICQVTVLPDDSPIEETLRKVPRTIRDNCPAQSAILHTLPSGHHEGCSSCIPCLYAWTNLTTGDRGATHKLKPRSFNKSFSAPTSLIVRRSLFSIITKYIPLQHHTFLQNGVWFLIITYTSLLRNSVLDSSIVFLPTHFIY